MRLKLALCAAVLALAPTLAAAQCRGDDHKASTSNCATGQSWDATTQSCVDTSA